MTDLMKIMKPLVGCGSRQRVPWSGKRSAGEIGGFGAESDADKDLTSDEPGEDENTSVPTPVVLRVDVYASDRSRPRRTKLIVAVGFGKWNDGGNSRRDVPPHKSCFPH
jgi:hypothetical protein